MEHVEIRRMSCQDDLQGLWKRVWIKAPTTDPVFADHVTRVFRAQSGALYADLRIPVDRDVPEGARCLKDLDPLALRAVMRAEGFAGSIALDDDICTWTREINWHGQPQEIDAGQMSFDTHGDLVEDGVHADYRELWTALPLAPLRALRVAAGDLSGVLVLSETMFLLSLGRRDSPATDPMIAALDAGAIPVGLPAHFETEYAFGHWEGETGIADLCTNPFLEGQCVLERRGGGWTRHGTGFDGTPRVTPLRT